ncbi:MAG: ECF-type sigma factor [Acidobacteriota bacterium]
MTERGTPTAPEIDGSDDTTELLRRWSAGDAAAAEAVLPEIYDQLHRIATAYFDRERPNHTLQPTAVVHEVFLRWHERPAAELEGRSHFFGIAARLMRQVLVDHARKRLRAKRGGSAEVLSLTEVPERVAETPEGILALDLALRRLQEEDRQKAAVVEMRFFGGLSNEEIAESLKISQRTVIREWQRARARLLVDLSAQQ